MNRMEVLTIIHYQDIKYYYLYIKIKFQTVNDVHYVKVNRLLDTGDKYDVIISKKITEMAYALGDGKKCKQRI